MSPLIIALGASEQKAEETPRIVLADESALAKLTNESTSKQSQTPQERAINQYDRFLDQAKEALQKGGVGLAESNICSAERSAKQLNIPIDHRLTELKKEVLAARFKLMAV